MTSIFLVFSYCFRRSKTPYPSSFGIITSSSIKSGFGLFSKYSRALSPLFATFTLYLFLRTPASKARLSAVSSTSNMVFSCDIFYTLSLSVFWQNQLKTSTVFCVAYNNLSLQVFFNNNFTHIQPQARSIFLGLCRKIGLKYLL